VLAARVIENSVAPTEKKLKVREKEIWKEEKSE
jgi:hypothetical protein